MELERVKFYAVYWTYGEISTNDLMKKNFDLYNSLQGRSKYTLSYQEKRGHKIEFS